MNIKIFFTVIITILSINQAFAVNYYVDAEKGNDKNNGKHPEKAWRSLEKANGVKLIAGDSLLLKNGTSYDGQLTPKGSGNKDAFIYIGTYGSGHSKARINANGNFEAALILYNNCFISISDIELTNTGTKRIPHHSGILVKANNCGTLSNITLRNLYIHDVNGSLVKKEGGGQGIHIVNGGSEIKSRFDGLLIENCRIERTERNGIIFDSEYWNRERWFPNLHVVIRSNLIEQVPGDGIVPLGCEGALVESNKMRDCTRLLPDGEAAAGIWPWSCDNTIIQYNEVCDHKAPWDAQGFDCDYNCRNTVIQYNYSHDNEGGFLLVCSPSDQKMPWSIGNDSSIVRFNLSVNDGFRLTGTHSGFSPSILITGPVKNTKIYSNIIIVTPKPAGCDNNLIVMDTWGGDWPIGTTISDNIFHVTDSATISLGKDSATVFKGNSYRGKKGTPDPFLNLQR
jgi:hypothetical protein